MGADSEVVPLSERRELLLNRSESLRIRMVTDCQEVSQGFAWVNRGMVTAKRISPIAKIVVGLFGALILKRLFPGKAAGKLLTWLGFAKIAAKTAKALFHK